MKFSFEHQIILYAKHWFLETDMFSDLKVFIKRFYGYDPSEQDISRLVFYATQKFMGEWSDHFRAQFIFDLAPENKWKIARHCEYNEEFSFLLTANCLSKLSCLVDRDMIQKVTGKDFEEPDYTLLPKSKNL